MLRMTKVEDDSDAALVSFTVAGGQAGSPDAFRLLVERYGRRLFRLAYHMTRNDQDAEDLVQETFLRAYRNLARFEARANFATWLYRICYNATLDHLRKRKGPAPGFHYLDDPAASFGAEMIASDAPNPERLLLSGEMRESVERAMAGLTPVERAAFGLRHYDNLSIAEIGAALGLREAATKNTIFRGVKKLRRELGGAAR